MPLQSNLPQLIGADCPFTRLAKLPIQLLMFASIPGRRLPHGSVPSTLLAEIRSCPFWFQVPTLRCPQICSDTVGDDA